MRPYSIKLKNIYFRYSWTFSNLFEILKILNYTRRLICHFYDTLEGMDFKINTPTALNKKNSIIFISKSNETKFHKFAQKIKIDTAFKRKIFEYMNISEEMQIHLL